MQARPPNNILLITGPGINAWNSTYVRNLIQIFGSHSSIYQVGNGVDDIPLPSIRSIANTYAFARGPKIVFMTMHGRTNDDLTHHVEIEKGSVVPTRSIFDILKRWITSPIFVFLASCYAGACAPDIEILPQGSSIFTTAPHTAISYTHDFLVLANTLSRFLREGVPLEYTMYLMAHSYLSNHTEFRGNHPCLILTGHGEILSRHFNLQRQTQPTPPTSDLIRALNSSPYSDFLKSIRKVLLRQSQSSQTSGTYRNIMSRIASHLKSSARTSFLIDSRLATEVYTILQHSSALLVIAEDEMQAITIANTHRLINPALLCEAIKSGLHNLAVRLLEQGIDCTTLTINKVPLIFFATEKPDLLRALINAGARVNITLSDSGSTPLHRANLECSEILLAAGANQNQVDNDGYTPIHTCIAQNSLAKFILLYKHPSTDRSILTPDAKSYSEYATNLNRSEIVEFLDSLNKKRKERDSTEDGDHDKELLKIRIRLDTKLGTSFGRSS